MNADRYVEDSSTIRFGIGKNNGALVRDLRRLASRIEAEDVAVQQVETSQSCDVKNFPFSTLSIRYSHFKGE